MVAEFYERLRGSLWFVPSLFIVGSTGLAVATLYIDGVIDDDVAYPLFGGDAGRAADILQTVASSMLQFTALVFTITIVVLQLASAQYSPRALRTFLRDGMSQFALGLFIGTFLFSLITLRSARGEDAAADEFIPVVSVFVAMLLVVASIGMFIAYAHHIAKTIQVQNVIHQIAEETRSAIKRRYPHNVAEDIEQPKAPSGKPDLLVKADPGGVIKTANLDALGKLAEEKNAFVSVLHPIGTYVPKGAPLLAVYGTDDVEEDEVRRCLIFGSERSMIQDPSFGFRQLLDVGIRALSPSLNDPTTATEVVNRLHDLLRKLIGRNLSPPPPSHGQDRVLLPEPTWEDYVALATEELRLSQRDSIQVARRMRFMLEDLLEAAAPDRKKAVKEQLRLLDAAVDREFEGADRKIARDGRARVPYGRTQQPGRPKR